MFKRILLSLSAASAVLLLSGSIRLRSRTMDELQVGDRTVPGQWKASSPTVQSTDGKYLAYEVAGKTPRVYLTKEKGSHTVWSFVDMKKFTRHVLGTEKRGTGRRAITVDTSGFTMRLRAANGPFRGWYLSRTKEGELVLTKEAGPASMVKFYLKEVVSTFR